MVLRQSDHCRSVASKHNGFAAIWRGGGLPPLGYGVRLAGRAVALAGLCLAAAGCSVSLPIAGFNADMGATGTIDKPDAVLFKALDQEDGRRAKAALATALDPQGNGATVAWDNPQSGAKGSFVAAAGPYARGTSVCRAFRAEVTPAPRRERVVAGSACRNTEGDWHVAEAREAATRS